MKKKRRNPIHAYKHLLAKDYDWDYSYLIALEKLVFISALIVQTLKNKIKLKKQNF